MSLVNDLLIELDRQDEAGDSPRAEFARGLNPRDRGIARRGTRWLDAAAITACSLFVVGGLSQVVAIPDFDAPPPVAARGVAPTAIAAPATIELAPAPATAAITPPPAGETTGTRIARPIAVHRVTIQNTERFARLRIDADRELVHRLQRDEALRHVELVFEGSRLSRALEPIELVGTPIRALSTERRGDDLHFVLGLDPGTRVQSQSLETAEGTTIFVDFQRRAPAREEPIAARAFRLGAHGGSATALEAPLATPPAESAQVEIAPSDAELERRAQEAARSAARSAVAAARTARDEGDLAAANGLYRSALERDAENRDALVEWATLLSEQGRSDDAIELVRRARMRDADDARLTMLEARLIESAGRIEDAIVLLERSRASLTEAPEVHALAAALLQRAGRHAEAIDRYEAIVRRYPGESRWWLGLGISLDAVDRAAEALDVYRIAMQIGTLSHPSRRWVTARIEALDEDREG